MAARKHKPATISMNEVAEEQVRLMRSFHFNALQLARAIAAVGPGVYDKALGMRLYVTDGEWQRIQDLADKVLETERTND